MTSKILPTVKMVLGLALVVAVGWFGYMKYSPQIILIFGVIFTVLYIQGKWLAWKMAWENAGMKAWIISLLTTLPVQLILVGVIYLIGFGLGSLITPGREIQALSVVEYRYALSIFLVIFGAGLILDRIGRDLTQ